MLVDMVTLDTKLHIKQTFRNFIYHFYFKLKICDKKRQRLFILYAIQLTKLNSSICQLLYLSLPNQNTSFYSSKIIFDFNFLNCLCFLTHFFCVFYVTPLFLSFFNSKQWPKMDNLGANES